jgi:hypothetical protein
LETIREKEEEENKSNQKDFIPNMFIYFQMKKYKKIILKIDIQIFIII